MGAALHADDLRTSAPSSECITLQDEVINQFSAETSLKLNLEEFEVVKIYATARKTCLLSILVTEMYPQLQECKMSWCVVES